MSDNKLVEDYKDKRVNSKSQVFIWWIDNKENIVGPLEDHDAVGVDAGLQMQELVWLCRSWLGDSGADQVM